MTRLSRLGSRFRRAGATCIGAALLWSPDAAFSFGIGIVSLGVVPYLFVSSRGLDAPADQVAMSVDVAPTPGGAAALVRGRF